MSAIQTVLKILETVFYTRFRFLGSFSINNLCRFNRIRTYKTLNLFKNDIHVRGRPIFIHPLILNRLSTNTMDVLTSQ